MLIKGIILTILLFVAVMSGQILQYITSYGELRNQLISEWAKNNNGQTIAYNYDNCLKAGNVKTARECAEKEDAQELYTFLTESPIKLTMYSFPLSFALKDYKKSDTIK